MKKFLNLCFYFLIVIIISSSFSIAQEIPNKEWQTFFEKSNFLKTPNYDESIIYFKKFEKFPSAKLINFGQTPQGRELQCLIVSKEKAFTQEKAANSKKAVVLIQNGIHAGEIEGKDASMLLLRDILVSKEKEYLLDNIILLVIPVFNVDGHERIGAFNRINQNGPEEMGWRTTAQNLNLNRDYMKADSPEMQALLKLFTSWLPDFVIDTHTTDGLDFQYTLNYEVEKHQNIYRKTSAWLMDKFVPYFTKSVEKQGYMVSPYVGFKSDNVSDGVTEWVSLPRLSTGYFAVQNRPSLLTETHMLKPYKDRVLATKSALLSTLEFINKNSAELKSMNREADQNSINEFVIDKQPLPVTYKRTEDKTSFSFKGIKYSEDSSWITGTKIKRYTGEKFAQEIPYYNKMLPAVTVKAPAAYLIPHQWSLIAERLKLHGVKIGEVKENKLVNVERYKFRNVKFAENPYEGRHQPGFEMVSYNEEVQIPEGTYIVYTNQRTIRVILNLLEPKAPDSFVNWGFFNAIFEQKEYFEDYSMEPIARKMAEDDPDLKKEFLKKLNEDESFRKDPNKRLDFFYQHSKYFDKEMNVYPVMRVLEKTEL
ncbi:MAG: M14 family metallopeptidase [Ignavibacteriales bacterium]|nr:M14 family metallopeptidase [Ignavibacteriales bacterium]